MDSKMGGWKGGWVSGRAHSDRVRSRPPPDPPPASPVQGTGVVLYLGTWPTSGRTFDDNDGGGGAWVWV